MEVEKDLLDAAVDPCLRPIGGAFRAEPDHRGESAVGGHPKAVGGDRLAERAGKAETVQRQDRAAARLNPIDPVRLARIRHWKHAHGIGAEHDLRVEAVHHCGQGGGSGGRGQVVEGRSA
ncbi:hypothetical protein GCM10011380_04850 [Sphingomonas metalli]|uniref:Uncharacterized protein n=1 Tax=Sphingomonas metalli TaxID=1779358 RepID=A0A916WPT6_9SPHN|nr:hypothetical protein GCM10011380_04850 [Sphingomonas metalli]